MKTPELLFMSSRDRDRLKVLHEVRKGHLNQRQAAEQLGMTDGWVRKLLVQLRREGDRGVLHRLRGRPSNRKLSEKMRERVVAAVKVAFVVCHAIGLETGSASQDYIQLYEGDAKLLTDSLAHIQKAATQILNSIGAENSSAPPA
jgi:hypothetical protein